MTVAELKKIIEGVPDEFIFEVEVYRNRSTKESSNLRYPYPYKYEMCQVGSDSYDIGWCDRKIKITVGIKELGN